MSFRWKEGRDSPSNLRRLARGQLRAAIAGLAEPLSDPASAVHDTRLRVKRLRSLLRLVRDAAPAEFRRQNMALRDAARALAAERDGQAVLESFDKLLAHAKREWGAPAAGLRALRQWRDAIVASQRQTSAGAARDERLRQVTEGLRTALAELQDWTAAAKNDKVVVAGFAEGYRRARRALKVVLEDRSAVHLHEWRKHVKYHRYQVRLFVRAWPAVLEVRCQELKRLSDLLGDDHDLVLVRQTLEGHAGERHEGFAGLRDLLQRRRGELQAEALPLGRLLFAEKPRRLTRRFRQYWRVYRESAVH